MSEMASQDQIDYQKEGMDQPESLAHQTPNKAIQKDKSSASKNKAKTQEEGLPKLAEAFLPPPLEKSQKSERKVIASLVLNVEGQDAAVLPYSLSVDVSEEAVQNLLNMTSPQMNSEVSFSGITAVEYPNKESIEANLSEAVKEIVKAVLTPMKHSQDQVLKTKTQKSHHKKDNSTKFSSQALPNKDEEAKSVDVQTMITMSKEKIIRSAVTLKNNRQDMEKKPEEPINQENN